MKNYGLISGLQSLLTIQRQISVTHHIQVVKKKKDYLIWCKESIGQHSIPIHYGKNNGRKKKAQKRICLILLQVSVKNLQLLNS